MPDKTNEINFNFRPRIDYLKLWSFLRKVAKDRDISMSALFNAIIGPLAAELVKQPKTHTRAYELNLGVIRIE